MYYKKPQYEYEADPLTNTEITKVLANNNNSYRIIPLSLKKIDEALNKIGYKKKSVKID